MQRRLPICWHQNILHISISGRRANRKSDRRRVNNKSRIFHYDGAEDTWWNMRVSCFLRAARVDIAFVHRLFIAARNARAASALLIMVICVYGYTIVHSCQKISLPGERTATRAFGGSREKKREPSQRADLRPSNVDCVIKNFNSRSYLPLFPSHFALFRTTTA